MKSKCLSVIIVVLLLLCCGCSARVDDNYEQQYSDLEYAPDFKLDDANSYYSTLNDSDRSLLLFWATWCPHCKDVIDRIDSYNNQGKLSERLFTISEDESLEDLQSYSGKYPIRLDYEWEIFDSYRLEHIPTLFIVEGNGKIVASSEGGEDCLELLDEYVAKEGLD
ncbi:MAG: redoxin domain-containing protein [Atopobiaceae bacterium]|nr:redoxin domain-containing protein [Atopobiaceae bacterium]